MAETAPLTPLLEQYEGVKRRYPGHLVLFRVGDFYETFGDDAKLLSKELDVTLTARSPDTTGARTPMAGVPHHAVDSYLGRLVRKGYKVAVCDQVEDARFAKGLVRREVTRVVTPGTALDDRLLPGADHSFLAAVEAPPDHPADIALVDITTGEWFSLAGAVPGVAASVTALAPYAPREILFVGASGEGDSELANRLRGEFPSARLERAPEPIPADDLPPGMRSMPLRPIDARLASYVRSTQPRLLPFIVPVSGRAPRLLRLDAKTLRHLEITRPMNPDDPGGATLLSTFDRTSTAAGHRTLAFWLKHPLAELPPIVARQDAVEALRDRGAATGDLTRYLSGVPDLSRIASRLAGRRLRPVELFALRSGLSSVERARTWLTGARIEGELGRLAGELTPIEALDRLLASALPESPSAPGDDSPQFRRGYSARLDELTTKEQGGLGDLDRLEAEERQATGIRGLKVGYNQVFGFYFEVTRPHLKEVPDRFERKQTLSGAERFTTPALRQVEERILTAREGRAEASSAAWETFLTEIEASIPALHRLNRAVGEVDALASFARVADERRHVRPTVDDGEALVIRDGRHAVLETTLGPGFVPNDTELDPERRLLVITGPNMAGKSTYMRQVGLIVVLAQAGACVPARFAQVGIVGALTTRMGFTDEIGRGKSSFMVEMMEVAEILRDSPESALVLLDEVGRGTSTFDGLALAWATLRHLHDVTKCRTILATHYHQLTELVAGLEAARNAHFAVREGPEGVVFLHRLVPGSTDRSYGLHVAERAGVPDPVIQEAKRLLEQLEERGIDLRPGRSRRGPAVRYTQGILLAAEPEPVPPVVEALRALDPERITPMEALAWVHEWRRRLFEPPSEAAR